ncbi:hypothetical protein FU658_06750 [Alkalisalibacterium limincola]|uniref:VanZ-like domain-containing protein n=1 Tax=Alkalisalibacterium limincola TaxID=2699169 RepID=A0A5C8KTV4_9GAMM|nr:hypothetical protein FU658_06750 [Alkalisalibacterium limincola]
MVEDVGTITRGGGDGAGVSVWLAWGRRPLAAVALVLTSLVFSAALFLPGGQVRSLFGATLVGLVYQLAAALPWSAGQVAHFVGFAWMALLLWLLRPDLRVLRVMGVLVLLAVFSELVQGLLDWREAHLADVQVNLLGAAAGLVLGGLGTLLAMAWRRARRGRGD